MLRERRFRFRLYVLGLALSAPVFLIVDAGASLLFHPSSLGAFGLWKLGGIVAAWLLALAFWLAFPVYAGADGLRATDGIGRYHDVRWEEMQKVTSILGFYWIRHGRPGKALMFPRFLQDAPGFRAYVMDHAPEVNPLRAYLQGRR